MAAADFSAGIESILVGMFHHRAGNVLPRDLAAQLPGFKLHATKASLISIVRREEFRRWATRPTPLLHGRTPIEACIERDRRDLLYDARYARLHKRYGGESVAELQSAAERAHVRVRAWEAGASERSS